MRVLLAVLLVTAVASADEQVQRIAPRRATCTPNGR